MADASRSGRVTFDGTGEKTVIAGNIVGGKTAIYRFFNSGKVGGPVTIKEEAGFSVPLAWRDSVDVPVTVKAIKVEATTAAGAEVVYDFLGMA